MIHQCIVSTYKQFNAELISLPFKSVNDRVEFIQIESRYMKILFMGTPDFAVDSLDSIYKSNHDLCGVVTAPDKKAGRGPKDEKKVQ